MSNDYVVTSKEVRPEFTAELRYDQSGQPQRAGNADHRNLLLER